MSKLLSTLFGVLLTFGCCMNSAQATVIDSTEPKKESSQNSVLENGVIDAFKIEQGIAEFTQEKFFSFLSTPVKSSGILKINNNNVIWQVNSPVFSKLLIIDSDIWQQAQIKTQNGVDYIYNKMVTHASIESLIQTVFTGNIDDTQWETFTKSESCVVLTPKSNVLSQAISQLELCLGNNDNERNIVITDGQKNITKIYLKQISNSLSDDDVNEFNVK